MTRTVLVTGANGLLGAQCVAALAKDPSYRTLAVWHKGFERLQINQPPNLLYAQCDVSDAEAVRQLFVKEHVDAILHTAALLPDASATYDSKAVLANVAATVNLAAAGRDAGCDRFIYCSSVSVYGATTETELTFSEDTLSMPEDAYAWTKLAGEQYLQLCCTQSAMHGICLRLSGLHGPGRRAGFLYNVVRAVKAGAPIHIASANAPFQFLYTGDAVKLILHALHLPAKNLTSHMTINAASCITPSLYDIAAEAVRMSGNNSSIVVGETNPARHQIMNTARQAIWFNSHTYGVAETLHAISEWLDTIEDCSL